MMKPIRFKPKIEPGWDFTRVCAGKDWHERGKDAILIGGNEATIYSCFSYEYSFMYGDHSYYQNLRFWCQLNAKWPSDLKEVYLNNYYDRPRCLHTESAKGQKSSFMRRKLSISSPQLIMYECAGPIIPNQCVTRYRPTGDHLLDKQANPFYHYGQADHCVSDMCDPNAQRRPVKNSANQMVWKEAVEMADCPGKDGKLGKCPWVFPPDSHGDQYPDGGTKLPF